MSDDLDREEQSALAEAKAGPFTARAEVRVTPVGMLAYGAMVSAILLSTAILVWAARRPKR
jgi:hypothetical protein